MKKRIQLTQSKARNVRLTPSRAARVDPETVREAVRAETVASMRVRGSPPAIAALRSRLLAGLRSTGGRPALDGSMRRQKIPMSDADWNSLEGLAQKLSEQGVRVTPGQVAAQLLRDAILGVTNEPVGVYPTASETLETKNLLVSEPRATRAAPYSAAPSTLSADIRAERKQALSRAQARTVKKAA